MLELTVGTKKIPLATSWDQAGPDGWQLLRDLVRNPLGKGKAVALKRLTGLTTRQWQSLTDEQLAALDLGTPWLALTPHATPFRGSVRVGASLYHFPLPNFENGSGIGYTLADEYFEDWLNDDEQSGHSANLLLATLLRPETKGVRQPPTTREEVERFAQRTRKLGPEWAAQALMYWMATRQFVHETYGQWLFRSNDAEADKEEETSFNVGWWGVWMDVAADAVFGNLEQVYRSNFHTLCVYLVRKEEAARLQRREMERMKLKNHR